MTNITWNDISRAAPFPSSLKPKIESGRGEEPSDEMIRMWREGGANVEPSTKMLALISFIKDWEVTGDKVICFSQCEYQRLIDIIFAVNCMSGTSMLDLVEMLFARYGLQNLRYDGSMDQMAREAVLARFRQPGGSRVILIRYLLHTFRFLLPRLNIALPYLPYEALSVEASAST
jgi:hypothetical protein